MSRSHRLATLLGVLLTTLALTGCGTTPTPMGDAKPVPPSRVLAKLVTKTQAPAILTVVRDSGLQGIEHVFELWVNGIQLAELRGGEFFSTPVDPGATFVEIRMFNLIGSVAPVQVETIFASNTKYVYRAGIDGQVKLHLRRDLALSSR